MFEYIITKDISLSIKTYQHFDRTTESVVVYSLYGNLNYPQVGVKDLPAGLLASAVTVILHWFFKNPLISIIAGTASYMFLI